MSASIFAFRPEVVVVVNMSKSVDFALDTPALGISLPEALVPENWAVVFITHPPVEVPTVMSIIPFTPDTNELGEVRFE